MGCNICGRGSCMSSFHSVEEQNHHGKYAVMSESELISECIDKDNEIDDMQTRINELEETISEMDEHST